MKTFKTILFALPLVLGLAAAGCGDDGDGGGDAVFSGCGNQFAYALSDDYTALAGVLADDVLTVDMSQPRANCGYLGREAGVADACGGRTLGDDVVDVSYSVLATGDPAAGVGDGVPADDKTVSDSFPYLAAPN